MRLLIVDDHPLFRVGLKAMLERQGFKVVGEASNGREAVEKALTLTIDAVLLDIKMPDMDGIEAARELRRRGFEGSIVMLTTFTEPALQVEAARAGANAFLSKEASPLEVAEVLEALKEGRMRRFEPPPLPDLTARELEVLRLLAEGLSSKQIAMRLDLSPETVRDYTKKLYLKLDAHGRVEALEHARRLGLI